jgi:hypothetical protein
MRTRKLHVFPESAGSMTLPLLWHSHMETPLHPFKHPATISVAWVARNRFSVVFQVLLEAGCGNCESGCSPRYKSPSIVPEVGEGGVLTGERGFINDRRVISDIRTSKYRGFGIRLWAKRVSSALKGCYKCYYKCY